MDWIKNLLNRVDGFQQRHRALAFPFAVLKKYGDDQGGNQAAVIAYYGFFSFFPLLLVLVTLLSIFAAHDPSLRQKVLNAALKHFPNIISAKNLSTLHRHAGVGLGLGIVGTLYGARGVASAAQNAFNHVWDVPKAERPGFPWNTLRSLGLIVGIGLGMIVTTILSGFGGGGGSFGAGLRVAAIAVAAVLNIGLFWLGFRLAVAKAIKARDLLFGAVVAALVWQVLQIFGSYLIAHEMKHATGAEQTFIPAIGLLWWIYIQAQLTIYSMEIDVVRARRLWPRSLTQPPLTEPDRRAYAGYVAEEQRRPEQRVEVTFDEEAAQDGHPEDAVYPEEGPTQTEGMGPSPEAPQPAKIQRSRSEPATGNGGPEGGGGRTRAAGAPASGRTRGRPRTDTPGDEG